MRRVKDNKYGYRSWTAEELIRFGKFLILPLIVVILVVVILVWDRNREDTQETVPAETVSEEAALPPETETAETVEETHEFTTGDYPEVQELMNSYFTAKQSADVETIYRLFGWTDTSGMESLRSQLQYDARYTEGYRNITCYTKPGLEEGTYLVFVSYDLKFKNSLTLAPGLLWNYVKTAEDGSLYLTDSAGLTQDELDFVAEAEKMDEIVLLKTQIYAKLRLALEEDADLAESYGILEKQGGASGAGQSEAQHEVTVQIGGSETAAESSAPPEELQTDSSVEVSIDAAGETASEEAQDTSDAADENAAGEETEGETAAAEGTAGESDSEAAAEE